MRVGQISESKYVPGFLVVPFPRPLYVEKAMNKEIHLLSDETFKVC